MLEQPSQYFNRNLYFQAYYGCLLANSTLALWVSNEEGSLARCSSWRGWSLVTSLHSKKVEVGLGWFFFCLFVILLLSYLNNSVWKSDGVNWTSLVPVFSTIHSASIQEMHLAVTCLQQPLLFPSHWTSANSATPHTMLEIHSSIPLVPSAFKRSQLTHHCIKKGSQFAMEWQDSPICLPLQWGYPSNFAKISVLPWRSPCITFPFIVL